MITRVVSLGDVPMGGENPIRIQSMTNTDTLDTLSTVEQTIDLVEAGCDYVRITTPTIADAENLRIIKQELRKQGIHVPLIADVHFNPKVAELAARLVEKVRINPGNYADKKRQTTIGFSEQEYREELERIAERFRPLLDICKEYGTAIRIGVNHGSLSDRIMSRYGDTPLGMAESAMEFLRISAGYGFHELVCSMKSSNIRVTTFATRQLVMLMQEEGMNYPIHLGVTEAGDGEDGRIKSAAGIGALLEDGIGDTIRVSLTEDPEQEIPVAKAIADRYNKRQGPYTHTLNLPENLSYLEFQKRETIRVGKIGGGQQAAVITSCSGIASFECSYFANKAFKPDFIYNPPHIVTLKHPSEVQEVVHFSIWDQGSTAFLPLWDVHNYMRASIRSTVTNFIMVTEASLSAELIEAAKNDTVAVFVFESHWTAAVSQVRRMFSILKEMNCHTPVVLNRAFTMPDIDLLALYSAADLAYLLVDGQGDGIWVEGEPDALCKYPTQTVFNILQAVGDRIYKTEYIACPSCGRTQFNIQQALSQVKDQTAHLTGLKIAVMGCIVNGPGEMADANYGYVGAGNGKVMLYKGKNLVKQGIDESVAVDELITIIKDGGDWVEP
ncbi:MAG: (E)-4-hydroxy-3-methylbut-2-enyl-diphosphate synthase [Bacteroidota bacterium]